MGKTVHDFQVFVKPAGAICNLHCSYCYYLDKKVLYRDTGSPFMSEDILERYIIQHIGATKDEIIMFSWHGGEPLMAGPDFFRKAVRIQKKNLPPGRNLLNGIQTNGTLITEEWCRLFADEGFIAGISIDGPERIHNISRRFPGGGGSFSQVIHGYNQLREYGIPNEVLCAVGPHNVDSPVAVYDFFRQIGAKYITFLPLVIPDRNTGTGAAVDSVDPQKFGEFLSAVFDIWVEKDIGRVKVQIIEEAARTAFDQDHTLCIFKVNCGGVPVVEHNGDFYSCDHFVDREHRLGNIMNQSLADLLDSSRQKEFGMKKSETLPSYCKKCEVLAMCNGECPKNRFAKTPDGEPGLNYLCAGYKHFFNHCRSFIETLRAEWKRQENQNQ